MADGKPGRPRGSKDSTPRTTQAQRDQVLGAKARLLDVLTGQGVFHLLQIIAEGPARWGEDEAGKRVLIAGNENFRWAMDFIADRCGMKREAGLDVAQPGGFVIRVDDARGGLGWPGMAVGGGDSDVSDRPSVAH